MRDKDSNFCGRCLLTEILVRGASASYLDKLIREHGIDDVYVVRDYYCTTTSGSDVYMTLSQTLGYYEGVHKFVNEKFPDEPDENIAVARSVHQTGAPGLACAIGLRDPVIRLARLSAKKLTTQPDET